MSVEWKYKIEFTSKKIYEIIEEKLSFKIPDEIKKLVDEANAASPDKGRVKVKDEERIFGAVLSFNENEEEADDVYTAIKAVNNDDMLPFGIDPFGNYYCYSGKSDTVVFWNHENGSIIDTEKGIEAFIGSFY